MTSLAVALTSPATTDPRVWVTATVVQVLTSAARLVVEVEDGAQLRVRRLAGPYRPGDVVVLLRDPAGTGAGPLVLGLVASPGPLWVIGTITAINAGTARITVTLPGGTSVVCPYGAGTYTVGGTVIVLLDATGSGSGPVILSTLTNPPAGVEIPKAPPAAGGAGTEEATALLRPIWSGTWRATRSAWDRWNADSAAYGGRSTLYQGSGSGSGSLTGLACYGDQFVGLGATEILDVTLTLTRVDQGWNDRTTTLQCAVEGEQPAGAPTLIGTTVTTPAIPANATTTVALAAAHREALRTGAAKGIATVGTSYGAVFGTSRGDGMAAAVRYRRAA